LIAAIVPIIEWYHQLATSFLCNPETRRSAAYKTLSLSSLCAFFLPSPNAIDSRPFIPPGARR